MGVTHSYLVFAQLITEIQLLLQTYFPVLQPAPLSSVFSIFHAPSNRTAKHVKLWPTCRIELVSRVYD